MIDRRHLKRAILIALLIEAVPLALGIFALVAAQGHAGNAIFAGLHMPSVLLLIPLDPVLEYFLQRGQFALAEKVSLVLVVIAQIVFFTLLAYWVLKLTKGKEMPNSASLPDTSTSPLRAQHGAAKRER